MCVVAITARLKGFSELEAWKEGNWLVAANAGKCSTPGVVQYHTLVLPS